jgi:hypothetical protein
MSATQLERKQHAGSMRAQARGRGYVDGLYGVENRREMQPHDYWFAYDAGYEDGTAAHEAATARLQRQGSVQ